MSNKFKLLISLTVVASGVLLRSVAAEPDGPARLEERERLKCAEQMRRIHGGILEFCREHKHLPGFLSDLSPKYCRPEEFVCPAKSRVGDQAWARERLLKEAMHDPKLDSTTYSYEFNSKLWGSSDVTFHQYKKAQRDYIGLRFGQGDSVPIVRCFLHDRQKVLNITYGGEIVETGREWEEKFGNEEFVHRELTIRALLPPIADTLVTGVPARPQGLGREQLDLTTDYNALVNTSWFQFPPEANTGFAELLDRPDFLRAVKFDARGVIQLKGEQLYRRFPFKRTIAIGQPAKKLNFLLGAYGRAEIGEKIGQIRLNYADETAVPFDITYGVDVLDWRDDPAKMDGPKINEKVAWFTERLVAGKNEVIRLYHFQIANAPPKAELASAEFEVSVVGAIVSKSAPAIFAITLEPPE